MSNTPLPNYARPPVVEVAISIFFRALKGLQTAHYGRFWSLNPEYARTEDQVPILENPFGGFSLEASLLPPLRRVFFVTQDNNYVMQLQPDFFAHNWRKVKAEDQYPSFEKAKDMLVSQWKKFKEFVEDEKLGQISVTRYDVTYVNHLAEESMGKFPDALEKFSPLIKLREPAAEHFLPSPKTFQCDLQFEIAQDRGTLGVSFKHGTRAIDARDVMQMDLSARMKANEDDSNLSDALETAHEWIVRGFTDLTSKQAHELWERRQ